MSLLNDVPLLILTRKASYLHLEVCRAIIIIDELSSIMAGGRYEAWLKFIDDESIRYWSNPKNLERASKMLPVKGLRMNSLRDYFTYIFVPSRKGRKVDEIRYDSKTDVKAVQVSQDTDIIYYYFNKINGKWLVHIPPID